MAGTTAPRPLALGDLRGRTARRRKEALVRSAFLGAATLSIVISVAIVASLVREAWTFIAGVELSSLWEIGWFPRRGLYDVKTLVVGTLLVTAIAMAVAAPLGLGAAVYLSEYARPRVRRVLKPALEILAGIPSVVVGVFALNWISPEVVQRLSEQAPLFNLAAAGLGVGILVIPIVASISEDAMRSVPKELREAAYGMGARQATVCTKVVIPAAVSGLAAAFIVAVSRAIGETMVVAIVAGATGGSLFSVDVFRSGQTMTGAMVAQAAGTDRVVGAGFTFQSLFFVGFLLFVITLALNLAAGRVVQRVRQRY
ncbi:MAG: phosphate ABC transporter permease subunit PstC [Acidimicrobiales bacterium]